MWVNEFEAEQLVKRSRLTLRTWRLRGMVIARKRGDLWEFDRDSLLHAREQMRVNYEQRPIKAGTGRGRFKPVGLIPLWED